MIITKEEFLNASNEDLCVRYPFLIPRDLKENLIYDDSTMLDYVPDGWRIAFGFEMCEDLREQLTKEGKLHEFYFFQVKEKWGRLCLYSMNSSVDIFDIIDKYEQMSWNYCCQCGKPATGYTTGWILPMCDECGAKAGGFKHYGQA